MMGIRVPLFSVFCIATLAAPAFAWPTIDVTSSEVVSVDPPRVRTTFVVGSAGYEPCGRQYIQVTPLDTQAVHIFECTAPPGWLCGDALPAGSGSVYFTNPNNAAGFTFSIVTELASPCVQFQFPSPVLLAKSNPASSNYDCLGDACLLLDAPVPARPATWGGLKVQYR